MYSNDVLIAVWANEHLWLLLLSCRLHHLHVVWSDACSNWCISRWWPLLLVVLHHFLRAMLDGLDERLVLLQLMPSDHFSRVNLDHAVADLFLDSFLDTLQVAFLKEIAQILLFLLLFLPKPVCKQRVNLLVVLGKVFFALVAIRVYVWVAPARITVNFTIVLDARDAPAARAVALVTNGAPGTIHRHGAPCSSIARMLDRSGRHTALPFFHNWPLALVLALI